MEFKDFSRTSPKIQGLFKTVRTLGTPHAGCFARNISRAKMLRFERFKMLSRYLTGLAVGWPSLLKNTVDFFSGMGGGDPYQFAVGILSSHSFKSQFL